MSCIEKKINKYAEDHTKAPSEVLQEIENITFEEVDYPQMLSGRCVISLLQLLVKISQAKKVLELGFFTGYSALAMAEALPDEGKIISCEIDPRRAETGLLLIDKSPHKKKIQILMGDALEIVSKLEESFDFIFIDANKRSYYEYYELCLTKLKQGGLMVLDNMLWWGKVLNPNDSETKILDALNKTIAQDHRVDNVLLTVRDGIQLVRKR